MTQAFPSRVNWWSQRHLLPKMVSVTSSPGTISLTSGSPEAVIKASEVAGASFKAQLPLQVHVVAGRIGFLAVWVLPASHRGSVNRDFNLFPVMPVVLASQPSTPLVFLQHAGVFLSSKCRLVLPVSYLRLCLCSACESFSMLERQRVIKKNLAGLPAPVWLSG